MEHSGVVPLISLHFSGCITEPPNWMQYSKWGLKSSQYREMITPLTYWHCSCCNSPGRCLPLLPATLQAQHAACCLGCSAQTGLLQEVDTAVTQGGLSEQGSRWVKPQPPAAAVWSSTGHPCPGAGHHSPICSQTDPATITGYTQRFLRQDI